MAGWSYEQDFEGLSTGNLSGQDSWVYVVGAQPQVQTSVVETGSQAVSVNVNLNVNTYRNVTAATDDGIIVYVSLRATSTSTTDNIGLRFHQGATWLGSCYINDVAAGRLTWRQGASPYNRATLLTGASANTWYRFGVEFDFTNNRARANYDNGTMSSWLSTPSMTQVDRIYLECNNGDAVSTTGYYDRISASYDAASSYRFVPQLRPFGGL